MTGAMNSELDQAVRRCLDALRRGLLDGHHDALAAVEVERRLEAEAERGFIRAVAEARAEGCSWDEIAKHAGFYRHGSEAGEQLFEALAVAGGHVGDRRLFWRCGDCDPGRGPGLAGDGPGRAASRVSTAARAG